jgi:hypothetical protein
MIEENAPHGDARDPGPSAPHQQKASMIDTPPPPTPGDPRQKPAEVPHDPNEVEPAPPREIPPAPAPDEGDRERA